MENEISMNEDFAENEFNTWAEGNGIEFSELSSDILQSVEPHKKRIINNLKSGNLTLNGNELEYTISKFSESFAGQKIKIRNSGAKMLQAQDGLKDTQTFEKEVRIMSACTDQDVGFFRKLHLKDLKVFEAICVFFQLV